MPTKTAVFAPPADVPPGDNPLPSGTTSLPPEAAGALVASVTCRETMRLHRRMLMRLHWPQLPFHERARLACEARRLMSDLTLALMILESADGGKRQKRREVSTTRPKPICESRHDS